MFSQFSKANFKCNTSRSFCEHYSWECPKPHQQKSKKCENGLWSDQHRSCWGIWILLGGLVFLMIFSTFLGLFWDVLVQTSKPYSPTQKTMLRHLNVMRLVMATPPWCCCCFALACSSSLSLLCSWWWTKTMRRMTIMIFYLAQKKASENLWNCHQSCRSTCFFGLCCF